MGVELALWWRGDTTGIIYMYVLLSPRVWTKTKSVAPNKNIKRYGKCIRGPCLVLDVNAGVWVWWLLPVCMLTSTSLMSVLMVINDPDWLANYHVQYASTWLLIPSGQSGPRCIAIQKAWREQSLMSDTGGRSAPRIFQNLPLFGKEKVLHCPCAR